MKSILVARETGEFDETLRAAGFETFNFEPIRTAPVEDFAEIDRRIAALDLYDGVFLTSPKAAEVFLARWRALGRPAFANRVYALGRRTRRLFENTGFEVVFRDEANTIEELLALLGEAEFAGGRFLFLRGDRAARAIPRFLESSARLDETVLYRTLINSPDEKTFAKINETLRRGRFGWICFFSPSGVDSFLHAFGAEALGATRLAAIGATTAGRLTEANLTVDFVPTKTTAKIFALELIEILKKEGKEN